ncbi:MAG: type II toxin-antitoxin system VapC family toxin [Acidobacteriota bacterium]
MIWLLDTNVLIHAVRGRPAAVRSRLRAVSPQDVAVSSITVAELWYGAEKSPEPKRKREAWRLVLQPFEVLPFDGEAAEHHARLRHALRRQPIGERDLLIAAIAIARGLSLVTHNAAEFARVQDLHVEDWTRPV